MSAITGIFYRDGRKVDPKQIAKMNNYLSHRGPDGSAVWFEDSVALGHQMLHTTPESLQEKLPFHDETSGIVITADARIDNRDELSQILGLEDNVSIPDSLFILEAYKKWGEKCPENLLGDFSFAIWDKHNNKMFCARDHMGIKPFYYYISESAYFFATELKAFFNIPEIPFKLNELKIGFHLTKIDDKKSTFHKNIFRLVGAHSITVSQKGIEKRKYWKLDPRSKIVMESDEDYIKAFKDIFSKAVQCRLRSAFPLGFELSGGLDSSSIACLAKNLLDGSKSTNTHNINTFSFTFKDFPEADETYYIQKVLEKGGFNSRIIYADRISPLGQIENILWNQDKPFHSLNEAVMYCLYKNMNSTNIRIVLTGEGGDSVLNKGQGFLRDLAVTMRWKKLFQEIKYSSAIFNENKMFYKNSKSIYIQNTFNKSFLNILLKQVIYPLIPEFLKNILRIVYNKKNQIRFKPDVFLLNKEFEKRLNLKKYLNELHFKPLKHAKTPRELHYFQINNYAHPNILEMIESRAAGFSIEPRHPFFDKRIIEFCYAIPTEMKYKFGWDRFILRKAMDNILPKEVQWRFYKQDYSAPLHRNFLLFGEEILDKLVYTDNKIVEEYVDLNKLKSIYKTYKSQNGASGISNSIVEFTDILDLWFLTTLYLWLQETKFKD